MTIYLYLYIQFLPVQHISSFAVPTIDLTKDSDWKVHTTGLTETQLAVVRVIRKVFAHDSILLEVSNPIRNSFKCKLWQMGKVLSLMCGTKRKQNIWEVEGMKVIYLVPYYPFQRSFEECPSSWIATWATSIKTTEVRFWSQVLEAWGQVIKMQTSNTNHQIKSSQTRKPLWL